MSELEAVINLCKNDGEIIVIGDTNWHFGKEVNIRCWGKTTDQARLMLNMEEKTNIEITDIRPKGKGLNYTYYREKMGKSYIDHVVVSINLTHKIKRCTIADDCIGNKSDHQEFSMYDECNWNAGKVEPQMEP